MRIETYDKITNRIGISILTFLIWLLGTAFFFGILLVVSLGFDILFSLSLPIEISLILAAAVGGPFSILATLFLRAAAKYGDNGALAFRDWWMIYGHSVDFGEEKSKKLDKTEVEKWLTENCSHFWRKSRKFYYPIWVFKDESEAMAFKLRWS